MAGCWLPPVDRIAASFAGVGDDTAPAVLVSTARTGNRSLPTLLSYWRHLGRDLPDPLAAELACHEERLADYSAVVARVRSVDPGVIPMKGPSMWALYPQGLVRQTADLDLLVPTAAGLWTLARLLADQGWRPRSSWAWRVGRDIQFHVVLRRPSRHPLLLYPDTVELATVAYEGDHVRRGPRFRHWPDSQVSVADSFGWFLEELGERRLHMRDVIDLAVLVRAAEEGETGDFGRAASLLVSRYGMEASLRRVLRAAAVYYPEALPLLTDTVRRVSRRSTVRRPWWCSRHPAAAAVGTTVGLARRHSVKRSVRYAGDAVAAVQRRCSVRRFFDWGTPLYGMALAETDAVDGVVASFGRSGAVWFDTPVGRFVGGLGPVLGEDWIEQAGPREPCAEVVKWL